MRNEKVGWWFGCVEIGGDHTLLFQYVGMNNLYSGQGNGF